MSPPVLGYYPSPPSPPPRSFVPPNRAENQLPLTCMSKRWKCALLYAYCLQYSRRNTVVGSRYHTFSLFSPLFSIWLKDANQPLSRSSHKWEDAQWLCCVGEETETRKHHLSIFTMHTRIWTRKKEVKFYLKFLITLLDK